MRLELFSELHRPNPMVLAIANVKCAALHKDTVRSCKPASQRIAIRSIAALACTYDRRDLSTPQIDSANNMTFRVRYVKSAFRRICNSFRTIEGCRQRRTAIARVSRFAGSGQYLQSAPGDING